MTAGISKLKIAIVGAGVMGRLLTLRLHAAGHAVTLWDRRPARQGGSSWIAAGMLAPHCELEHAELLIHKMGVESLRLWPQILAGLEGPVFFQKKGSLVVAHPQDRGELQRFSARLRVKLESDPHSGKELASEDLRTLEPNLFERFSEGLFFPEEGQISPPDFFNATAETFRRHSIRCFFETAAPPSLFLSSPEFDWTIDCRGIEASIEPDLRGVRGELILVEAPLVQLNRPIRIMHPRYPLYIVPRPQNRFLIGATQLEDASLDPISIRSTLELLSAAYAVHPSFAEGQIIETRVGLRPAFPDHLPRIRIPSPGQMRVNGLYRHGFLIAPRIAEIITEWLGSIAPASLPFSFPLEVPLCKSS